MCTCFLYILWLTMTGMKISVGEGLFNQKSRFVQTLFPKKRFSNEIFKMMLPLYSIEHVSYVQICFWYFLLLANICNIPDVTVTKIWILASSALHRIVVEHNLMHQLKMSLIWLNVPKELKCVYLVWWCLSWLLKP